MEKFQKAFSLIIVIIASFSALFLIIKHQMDGAILAMTIMFTFTNIFRARTFKEKGHDKEAKWMKMMAIIFAILSIVVLGIIITD